MAAFPEDTETNAGKTSSVSADGKFALVRTENERVVGYLVVCGSELDFRGEALVRSSMDRVSLVNDVP